MTKAEIKETLEQQLQLLAERSKKTEDKELWSVSSVMNSIVLTLIHNFDYSA